MDPLREEKNQEDNNLNSGSLEVDDKTNEENPSCLENGKSDEKDATTSLLITDENNPPPQELKDGPAENNNPMEFVIAPEKSKEDGVKNVNASLLITDLNNSPQESKDDPENDNPVEFFKAPEKIEEEEEGKLQGEVMEITTYVNVIAPEKSKEDVKTFLLSTDENNQPQESKNDPANNNPMELVIVTEKSIETDVKDATTSSLITDENNAPQESKNDSANNNSVEFFIAPEKIGEEEVEGKLLEERMEVKTTLSTTEDKKQGDDHKELNNKPFGVSSSDSLKDGSDDDSVDSSSDSSSSSSTSASSSDDEMDVDDDDDDDVVEPPKKLSPVIEEKPEELKENQENGETTSIPDFPIYRDNDGESSQDSSSEDSTSSSTSDMEDNVTDYPRKQRSPSRKDSESEERTSRPRVKGEIFPEELPALENLNICVGDDVDLQMLGKVTSVIKNIAVVRAEFTSPIDQDSFVFLKDRACIGKVHDIIGPVRAPFYTVLLDKDNTLIPLDTEIYCAPKEKEYTKYVFVNDLKNLKGSDASWEHDIEPPAKFLDYSDDEQERLIKKHNKCKNSAKANSDSKDDPDDGNGKSQQKDRSASSSSSTSNTRKWRKRDHNGGANSNTFQDASQRSMFACSATWPPGNDHASFTSWPPPTPPPPPPTPPLAHYQRPNNPTFYQNSQLNHPIWHSNYAQPPNPPVGMMMQQHPFRSPWNYHQNPSNMDPYHHHHHHHRPQSGQPFIPPPPNQQPWFHGQWRQPYNPQGPLRPPGSFDYMRNPPPRFSQPPQFPGLFP